MAANKPSEGQVNTHGVPSSEQDPKRRLGGFVGTGEPSRKGGRTTGIVGQTKKKSGNDKKGS